MKNNILTLWDIDGNLVNVYKCHTSAYCLAIKQTFGVKLTKQQIEINYGLPANDVIINPLVKLGFSRRVINKSIKQALLIYANELKVQIKKLSIEKANLPGVKKLLTLICKQKILTGIVTGNIELAGKNILTATNLDKFFSPKINSYGDNITYRHQIVAKAVNNAKKLKKINNQTKIFIFGDMPADIESAKKFNYTSIAVIKNSNNSNSSPNGPEYKKRKKILIKAEPDYLLDDYTDTKKILSILNK